MKRDFLTVADISQELNLSKRTVRTMLKKKLIPGRKIAGQYITTRKQLEKFIEEKEAKKEG